MVELKNHKTYYSKTIALFIMEAMNDEEVNWVWMLFWSLKPNMEKWLLGGNMPLVLYVTQMVDMLL